MRVVTVRPRTGPGTEDKHAASVRADSPVPPDCGLYYYEITIINRGRDGFIGTRPVCLDGHHLMLDSLCVPLWMVVMLCSALLPECSVSSRGRGTRGQAPRACELSPVGPRWLRAGIGFAASEVELNRLPGWDAHSYGYHGDDGNAFKGSGKGYAYGPTFTTGAASVARSWLGVGVRRQCIIVYA